MLPPLQLRVPAALVVLHEEQLDHRRLEHERALPGIALALDPVERQRVDRVPILRGIQQVEIDVLARLDQPAQLFAPASEDPRLDLVRIEQGNGALYEGEIVNAVAATSASRGNRRETICETPSVPIVTP